MSRSRTENHVRLLMYDGMMPVSLFAMVVLTPTQGHPTWLFVGQPPSPVLHLNVVDNSSSSF